MNGIARSAILLSVVAVTTTAVHAAPFPRAEQKLTGMASVSAAPDAEGIGDAVAVAGSWLFIGAPTSPLDLAGSDEFDKWGAVYVFRRSAAGDWQHAQRLTATNPGTTEFFGRRIAAAGGQLFVGASGAPTSDGRTGRGAVDIFTQRDHDGWVHTQRIRGTVDDVTGFGSRVAATEDILVVGSPLRGTVHIHERDGTGWFSEIQEITPPGPQPARVRAIAASGQRFAVGDETGADAGGVPSGVVHIYERDGAGYVLTATLAPHEPAEGMHFGAALAMHGDWLVVGVPRAGGAASSVGDVYVFRAGDDGDWTLIERLSPGRPAGVVSGYGAHVAMDASRIVVAEPAYSFAVDPAPGGGADRRAVGVAHVYRYADDGVTRIQVVTRTDINPPGGASGGTVAVEGDDLLLGVQGAIYAFRASRRAPLDLVVRSTAVPPAVDAGDEVTFIVDVENTSMAHTGTGVLLRNPVPPHLVFTGSTPPCELNAGEVRCRLGEIPASSEHRVSITMRADTSADARITNFVTAFGDEPDPDMTDNWSAKAIAVHARPATEPSSPAPQRRGGGALGIAALTALFGIWVIVPRRRRRVRV